MNPGTAHVIYELVITVCLISHPVSCRKVELPLVNYPGIRQCLRSAPRDLVRWSVNRPKWKIARWTCLGHGESI